ncbi:MAG TPA: hypothetical protein VGQ67_12055 [Candidatus Polarisedimenticolia bacterium]|jgi:hypothetical protein|nr:hypothetical protein [Candidatus Polarisedimenticolia bacterium]
MVRNPSRHRSPVRSVAAFLAVVAAPILMAGAASEATLVFGADTQAPAEPTAPAKKPAKPKPAAKPVEAPKPDQAQAPADQPTRFTDDDLEKYHKPKPAPEADQDAANPATEAAPAAPAIPGAPAPANPAKPAVAKAPAAKTPPAKTAVKKPKPNLVPPPPDPATLALAKSALDAARERELKARRDRIEGFETRLQYLRAKRDAILNPTGSQMGSTGPRAFQYDQNGNPVTDPKTGKPVTKPDISPGRGTAPVAPIFVPLPEAQTDEDRERDKTMKVKDLLASVEAEIKSVEADLDSAKTELIDYETRFAPGTGAP